MTRLQRILLLFLLSLSILSCQKEEVGKSHLQKGLDYSEHGLLTQAAEEFKKGIAQNPGDELLLYNHALALLHLGEFEKAEGEFKQVLLLNPTHARALNNLGVMKHGNAEFAQAEEYFRQAIVVDKNLIEAHTNLGLSLRAAGKSKESELAYREALKLEPRNPLALDGLEKLGVR